MMFAQRTGSRFCTPGGTRALCIQIVTAVVVLFLAVSSAQANGQSHKTRFSSDLEAILTGNAAMPAGGVDVIVPGSSERVQRIAARYGAAIKKSIKAGAVLTLTYDQLSRIANDAELGALSSDQTMRSEMALVTRVTGAEAAWHGAIAKLGAVTGKGIGIAIIDTGVDNHTALAGRLIASFDFTGEKNTGTGGDSNGHGTHVAGIVAAGLPKVNASAAPVGMAPGAHIVSLKVLGADGSGRASDVIEAIDHAIAYKDVYQLRIINLSLGAAPVQSYRDDPVCQAVERAVRAGLMVVASAGNHGEAANDRPVLGAVSTRGFRRSRSRLARYARTARKTRATTRSRRGARRGRRRWTTW